MTSHLPTKAVLAAALLAASGASSAHISYSGRNFGTLTNGGSATISNQTVTSNYGWADASDLNLVFNTTLASTPRTDESAFVSGVGTDDLYLGDSHKGKAFRFHLDSSMTVTITESARADSGLTPAFSVYQGLAAIAPFTSPQTSADHDFATASRAWRATFAQGVAGSSFDQLATNGSWNALGDWAIGGDGDAAGVGGALSTFAYRGSAAGTTANGSVSGVFTLGPGDYTIFVGGNSLAAKSVADSTKAYALTLGISAVTAVPEPQTWLLMLAGGALLVARRRAGAQR